MNGPIDIAAVRTAHRKFIRNHKKAVDAELASAGRYAQRHVEKFSKFKRRSARSVKDATKFKIVKTSRGRIVKIRNNKTRRGYNISAGLEHGTKPHKIVARRKKALAFSVGGSKIIRRSVNHPGTPAYKFLSSAQRAAYERLGKRLKQKLPLVAKKF